MYTEKNTKSVICIRCGHTVNLCLCYRVFIFELLLLLLKFQFRSWTLSLAALRVKPESESTESEFAKEYVKNSKPRTNVIFFLLPKHAKEIENENEEIRQNNTLPYSTLAAKGSLDCQY